MSLTRNLTTRLHGHPTGYKDVNGKDILYGDFVECHSNFFIATHKETRGGWDMEVRVALHDEENNCPALWLKAINSHTDPIDWDNDKDVGYLVVIEGGDTDPRLEWLKKNGFYDETAEMEWLKASEI